MNSIKLRFNVHLPEYAINTSNDKNFIWERLISDNDELYFIEEEIIIPSDSHIKMSTLFLHSDVMGKILFKNDMHLMILPGKMSSRKWRLILNKKYITPVMTLEIVFDLGKNSPNLAEQIKEYESMALNNTVSTKMPNIEKSAELHHDFMLNVANFKYLAGYVYNERIYKITNEPLTEKDYIHDITRIEWKPSKLEKDGCKFVAYIPVSINKDISFKNLNEAIDIKLQGNIDAISYEIQLIRNTIGDNQDKFNYLVEITNFISKDIIRDSEFYFTCPDLYIKILSPTTRISINLE